MGLNIVFIGAGSLATHLSLALKKQGYTIVQVYSRTIQSAKILADKLDCTYTIDPQKVINSASIYFVAINDSAYEEVLPKIDFNARLVVHTAGSMPMHALAPYSCNIGVFYPLQTFSKERDICFREIPIFFEAEKQNNAELLKKMAEDLSGRVFEINSEQRRDLHLAAVFCCNFVNHLYMLSADIVEHNGLDFEILMPLIRETASKIGEMHPAVAQTGPAVRYDKNIINNHLALLENDKVKQKIYELLSTSIFESQK